MSSAGAKNVNALCDCKVNIFFAYMQGRGGVLHVFAGAVLRFKVYLGMFPIFIEIFFGDFVKSHHFFWQFQRNFLILQSER